MNIRVHGKKYEINYRIPGYDKKFYESFDTLEEANIRVAEIQYEKAKGILKPPTKKTTSKYIYFEDFLDIYIRDYGTTHWGDSYYSLCIHRINDYIKPYIGKIRLIDITTKTLDEFYAKLLLTPAVQMKGHKTNKTISYDVIDKCHCVIRSALTQAVRWGYIPYNPAISATIPKKPYKERTVWTPQQAQKAILCCTNTKLKACLLLAIGCSMREGEILGLQWKYVHIDAENKIKDADTLEIKQELKRCDKSSLEVLEKNKRSNVYFTFPDTKQNCTTCLVLKVPKTNSSIRTVYIPDSVVKALIEVRHVQDEEKKRAGEAYKDYDLVFSQPDGRPMEERYLKEMFDRLIDEANLPKVVFHSLRHLSTSIKLKLSGGDIKAVQGDTGHAQASMVTQVYSHSFDEDRKRIADLMETAFFQIKEPQNTGNNYDQLQKVFTENPLLVEALLSVCKLK